MDKRKIIKATEKYVKILLKHEGSGHDWWHIYRVWSMAKKLGQTEKADMFIVEIAALLHDIADRKLNNGDEEAGLKKVAGYLTSHISDKSLVAHILFIIQNYSYTSHLRKKAELSLEGQIVQDADRLDALGAIGIARAFAYGGHAGRMMYDPALPARKNVSAEEYANRPSPTINHFYEKLLLLKDLMNTNTAKRIAEKRHKHLENYLKQFYKEWEGEL